ISLFQRSEARVCSSRNLNRRSPTAAPIWLYIRSRICPPFCRLALSWRPSQSAPTRATLLSVTATFLWIHCPPAALSEHRACGAPRWCAHIIRLNVQPLRGNLDTRLRALDAGACTAMILAAAGLIRLGLEQRIRALLAPELSLPAASQGALGIEIREDRPEIADWLAPLNHLKTALAVYAERTVARALGGNCAIPLAAFAEWIEGILLLRACIAQPDGARFLRARACAAPNTLAEAETLGYTVADDLARQGAQEMVRAFSEQ